MKSILKNPLFVALDVDRGVQAMELAQKLALLEVGFKLGPRLLLREGPQFVQEIASLGPVFIDNKYYDIPSTMEHALRASHELGASFATIHAACGKQTLTHLAKVEKELSAIRPFKILAVTVLTSFSQNNLPPHWKEQSTREHVLSLAETVLASGLTGLVCSAEEAQVLRERFSQAFLTVPGVRRETDAKDDQARIATPEQAILRGADAIVVGRPITAAKDPVLTTRQYIDDLKKAQEK